MGERKSGTNGEGSIDDIQTLSGVRGTAGERLGSAGSSRWVLCGDLEGWDGGGDVCIITGDFAVVVQKPTQHCKKKV